MRSLRVVFLYDLAVFQTKAVRQIFPVLQEDPLSIYIGMKGFQTIRWKRRLVQFLRSGYTIGQKLISCVFLTKFM